MRIRVSSGITTIVLDPLGFVASVLRGFRANQGILLSGAVAYYSMLSVVPLVALILLALSQFVDRGELIDTIRTYLTLATVDESGALISQMEALLDRWRFHGFIGLAVLLFFGSMAFTALENAMSVIFHHRVEIHRRHFLVSAVLPYVYMVVLTVGLLTVTFISAALNTAADEVVTVLGYQFSLDGPTRMLVYLLGIGGEFLLLTSLYLVMPVGRIALRHAVIGGVAATVLWEITRHVLAWWIATLSVVNVVYGSFASAIIILVSFEAAALIVLLGAQVIAEYERLGLPHNRASGFHT